MSPNTEWACGSQWRNWQGATHTHLAPRLGAELMGIQALALRWAGDCVVSARKPHPPGEPMLSACSQPEPDTERHRARKVTHYPRSCRWRSRCARLTGASQDPGVARARALGSWVAVGVDASSSVKWGWPCGSGTRWPPCGPPSSTCHSWLRFWRRWKDWVGLCVPDLVATSL